jgi:hypothetical protein
MQFTVGFSKAISPLKIGSKLIQLVEKRNFSHVYIEFVSPVTGVKLISQASHGYVNLVNADLFFTQNEKIEEYLFFCDDQQWLNIESFIHKNLGKPYSQLQLLLIGIKKIMHITPAVSNQDEAFICSEWAKRVCDIDGLRLDSSIEIDYMTPSDLNTLIRNMKLQ